MRTAPVSSEVILEPGRTCWRLARADRFALIVDAAEYFARLKAAMTCARERILLIGWDFDTRIRLDPDGASGEWPDKLGSLIDALVERRPDLQIHVLKWDLGVLQTLGRGATPLFVLDWMTSERVHLRLDGAHPAGACHHQKIAVIDDSIAFCGGIDITVGRWDTPEHRDADPRRASPWGFAQPPWHDATAAVDGEAARALGELARERWAHATGETLPPPSATREAWPEALQPTFRNVTVGIARTQPASEGQAEAREIEALCLAAVGAAREFIYIESQYLASRRIGEALAARLAEDAGPEIVVINPLSAEGWLEEEVMGTARALLVGRLRAADRGNRFRIYHPVAAGGTPIYVHAKVMIVDDRLLKVGSSNLNNRSMGLDTECDLAVEASPNGVEGEAVRETIRSIRHRLLAEHLGVAPEEIAVTEREETSLARAVDRLRAPQGRTLVPLEPEPVAAAEKAFADGALDPDRPEPILNHLRKLASSGRSALRKAVGGGSATR